MVVTTGNLITVVQPIADLSILHYVPIPSQATRAAVIHVKHSPSPIRNKNNSCWYFPKLLPKQTQRVNYLKENNMRNHSEPMKISQTKEIKTCYKSLRLNTLFSKIIKPETKKKRKLTASRLLLSLT